MTTIPTDSARNPQRIRTEHVPDSALNKPASQPASNNTTSSRTDAHTRETEKTLTARIREIHPLDAITTLLVEIRPDWKPEHVRAVIARDRRPWRDVVAAAFDCAYDPTVRSPAAIENHGTRSSEPTPPKYPTVHEALNPQLCPHEFRVGACPLCRRHPQGGPS